MALNYKDLKKQLDNTPLSEYELKRIKDVEDYIDKEILKQFDKSIYKEITIDYGYAGFRYSPISKSAINDIGVSRIPLMKKELELRFRLAGWEIAYRMDDGMSMYSADYMILKGRDR